jgi:tRNA 2-selenouridine synthase
MASGLPVSSVLKLAPDVPVLDVRSPGEYAQGHFPGAISFPLFSDSERAEVGTLYKQVDPQSAFLKGLEIVGPKMAGFVRDALTLAPGKRVVLYCWRGGKRSGSMAWLLEAAGFEVFVLKGGYKAFRQALVAGQWNIPLLQVLGGLTGSGKTEILGILRNKGEMVLDLEAEAKHKGSAFGNIGEPPQPTQEQFENNLFVLLYGLSKLQKRVWVEDESKAIGRLRIPAHLFEVIRDSPHVFLEVPLPQRLDHILAQYGTASVEILEVAIQKLAKRLGGLRLKEALLALNQNNLRQAAVLTLEYYDKAYLHGYGLRQKETCSTFRTEGRTKDEIADWLIQWRSGLG